MTQYIVLQTVAMSRAQRSPRQSSRKILCRLGHMIDRLLDVIVDIIGSATANKQLQPLVSGKNLPPACDGR
jgi:hypothetical protein